MALRVAGSSESVMLFQEKLAKEYGGYDFPGGLEAASDMLVLSNSNSLVKTRAEENWMLFLGSTIKPLSGSEESRRLQLTLRVLLGVLVATNSTAGGPRLLYT